MIGSYGIGYGISDNLTIATSIGEVIGIYKIKAISI
jgi:hypothetical protein